MSKFKKTFLFTLILTVASWSLAWTFSALAGESPKQTLAKLQYRLNQGKMTQESETLDLTGVEKISVQSGNANVRIEATAGDQAVATYAGAVKAGEGKMLHFERDGKTLVIRLDFERETNHLVWDLDDSDDESRGAMNVNVKAAVKGLHLNLPANVLKFVEVRASTGDVTLKNIKVDAIEIVTSTGDIELRECAVKDAATLKSTTGEVEVQSFAGKLRTTTTTGDIEVDQLSGDEFESDSTTGDVNIDGINVRNFRARATTGDISVKVADGAGWKFSLQATSGDIENDFKDDDRGDKLMQIQTTSGEIRVHR